MDLGAPHGELPASVLRISYEEAVTRLKSNLKVRPSKAISVPDAKGWRLSEDLVAGWPMPRYSISHMDGYAVRFSDVEAASDRSPVTLRIEGLSRPDGMGPRALALGTCVRVLTGGRLPEGADTVVAQELTRRAGEAVIFSEKPEPHANIHDAGSDVREGMTLFTKGHLLNARDLSFLLSYGVTSLHVRPRLRVGVLATGSELTERRVGRIEGKVIETNRMVLTEALEACGFSVDDLGLAKDDPKEIASLLLKANGRCDAILTTGGSSVSEADLVPDAVGLLGGTKIFHGLLVRPSRTLGAYLLGDTPVFLLSGLIQGSLSALFNMVYPALRFMAGDGWQPLPSVKAFLSQGLRKREGDKFRQVSWVTLRAEGGRILAEPAVAASSTRFVVTKVSGFVVGDPGQGFQEGEIVEVRIPYGFGLEDSLGGR